MDTPMNGTAPAGIEARLAVCRWPELPPPYDQALRDAVRYILEAIPDLLGILASGTIVRGDPKPTSDLDIYVIRRKLCRQRIQRWFNGVPAEIFVNPVPKVRAYIKRECREGRPITAHMVGTSFIVLQLDPVVEAVRKEARAAMKAPFSPTEERLTQMRYAAATRFEDATDIAGEAPETAAMIMGLAVRDMVHYVLLRARRYLPRDKDLIAELDEFSPELAELTRRYYRTGDPRQQMAIGEQIADRTIETRGFFAWASEPEEVSVD